MDQKATAVELVAVPATIVVSTMLGVEQPLEVHREDRPDDPIGNE
ncbi:hypothetical protein SDC9_122503 [bioreactor metagenome]|uniref:Uncharacterized protein n=1 Tax=bioreactor metagenome TaxID=1076179 RepID=A0A645CF12_9ZZZZ